MFKKLAFSFVLITYLTACSSGEDASDRTSPSPPDNLEKLNTDNPEITRAETESEEENDADLNKDEPADKKAQEQTNYIISPSTGLEIEEGAYPHFAAVIENSPNARPQSGLSQADIVFEMKTEGNISRYLAFFHDQLPDRIGPVRSARHYFLSFPVMFHTPFIHYGGSPQAYENIAMMDVYHIDGMSNGTVFSRDKKRKSPHNVYLYPDRLTLLEEERFAPQFNYQKSLSDLAAQNEKEVTDISFAYNEFTSIRYKWDEQQKSYLRYQENELQKDQDNGKVVTVKNIIFLEAPHSLIPGDSSNRIDIDFSGEGKITYISGGNLQTGTWRNENGNLVVRDEYNKEIHLTPGNTWVQIIEPAAPINVH